MTKSSNTPTCEGCEREPAYDVWFRRQVQAGLDSANAGNLIPSSEVEARFAARRAATRQKFEAISGANRPSTERDK